MSETNTPAAAAAAAPAAFPTGDVLARWALQDVISHMRTAQARLADPALREVFTAKLHPTLPGELPDAELSGLAATAIDLLHEVSQVLQPDHLVLADHFYAYLKTKCLVGVLELGVPDVLEKQGPLTFDALAAAVQARPDRLRQVMYALRNDGLFAYDEDSDTYANNVCTTMLTTDHWTQWRNWVDLKGNEYFDMARGIPACLRADTTRSAAQHSFDTDENMFAYMQRQGWVPRLHRMFGGGAIAQAPGLIADYPWGEIAAANTTLMDVGGGGGGLIVALLRSFPTLDAGIFDLAKTIEHTKTLFAKNGQYADVADRVAAADLIAGDFFQSVPSYKVYTMKWCLHDWSDDESVQIMRNVRKAIIPSDISRLVVLESILTDGASGRMSRYGDINVMMTAKGQVRSVKKWHELAARSGWEIRRIYPMRNAWMSAIDMRPAAQVNQ